MMKELKPKNYKNFKQTLVVKNQIDTVNGKLMLNTNTEASTRATYTFDITQSLDEWDTVIQRNIVTDSINNSHEMAKSIVGCGMITLEHTFELDTPIVSEATVTITLGGHSYILATNTHAWGDGNYSNAADAASFIINHAQHTEADWQGNSQYVDYDKGSVNMFAWVKDAKYLIDYSYVDGYTGFENDWTLTEDVANKLPPSSNILTTWLTDAWSIYGTGLKSTNGQAAVGSCKGYWTQNNEKVQSKMMYPSPLPEYRWHSPFSSEYSRPSAASSLTISFNPEYRYISATVKKLDGEGYRWKVTITIPRFYVYLAICRAAQIHAFNILKFDNNDKDSCPSLGFVDYINSAQIDLIGEVLDESTEEFSQQLNTAGTPIEGKGDYIQRLSNNELLTIGSNVTNLFDGKVEWRVLTYLGGTFSQSEIGSGGEYYIHRFGYVPKGNAEYAVIKKNYENGALLIQVAPGTGSSFNPGDVYNTQIIFNDNYSTTQSQIEIIINGVSGSVEANDTYIVRLWGFGEGHFTGSWKDYATKLLINNFGKGKIVVNCDVEASYILENGGIKINDLFKIKNLYNQWISRNNKVIFFEVKNIRKIFESDRYTYQLTMIESSYLGQSIGSITLFDYSDYSKFTDNFSHGNFATLMPKRIASDGYFVRYISGTNLVVSGGVITPSFLQFTFETSTSTNILEIDNMDITVYEAVIQITSIQATRVDATHIRVTINYEAEEGEVDDFDVNAFSVLYEWPLGLEERPEPTLAQNGGNIACSGYGKAIVAEDITVLDNGYIRLDDYDEFNDCIVYIVRCPLWSFGDSLWLGSNIDHEPIGGAGFYERYSKQENKAFLYGTRGHADSGLNLLLIDNKNRYLLDKNNTALEVATSYNINYTGLYMIAVLKPSGAQMSSGIVPFIRGSVNSNDRLRKTITYGQGQYYHIKGASFENLDALWQLIVDSGELNNYHDKVYSLPSLNYKYVSWKVYNSSNGWFKGDAEDWLEPDEEGYALVDSSYSGLADTTYIDTNNAVTKVRARNYTPVTDPTEFDSGFVNSFRTVSVSNVTVNRNYTPARGTASVSVSLEDTETFCTQIKNVSVVVSLGSGTVVNVFVNAVRNNKGCITSASINFLVDGATAATRCTVSVEFGFTNKVDITDYIEGTMGQYKEKTVNVYPGMTVTILDDNWGNVWNQYHTSRVTDVRETIWISFNDGADWEEWDGEYDNNVSDPNAPGSFIIYWGTDSKYPTYSGQVLIAPEIILKPKIIHQGTDGVANATVAVIKKPTN